MTPGASVGRESHPSIGAASEREPIVSRADDSRRKRAADGRRPGRRLHAQARGEFHVEYQPILATASNRVIGFEALLRWIHPTLGSIPPAMFIPMAEKSGLINHIGAWVLVQACADLRRWQAVQPGPEHLEPGFPGADNSGTGTTPLPSSPWRSTFRCSN